MATKKTTKITKAKAKKTKQKPGPKPGCGPKEAKHSARRIELTRATTLALGWKEKQVPVPEIRATIAAMKWEAWEPWQTDKAVYDALNKAVTALPTENAMRLRHEIHQGYAATIRAHLARGIGDYGVDPDTGEKIIGEPCTKSGELATRTLERLAKLYGVETHLVGVTDDVVLRLMLPAGCTTIELPELPDYKPDDIDED